MPPLWWERLLGCRVSFFGTAHHVHRAYALRALGLLDTDSEDDSSDPDDAGDGRRSDGRARRSSGHRSERRTPFHGRLADRVPEVRVGVTDM